MSVPSEVYQGVLATLASHSQMAESRGRRALLLLAGIDDSLMGQISLSGSPTSFLTQLLDSLAEYGTLDDGRDALAAVLTAAKKLVGREGQDRLDRLVAQWGTIQQDTGRLAPSIESYLRMLETKWRDAYSPLLPDGIQLADVAVRMRVVAKAASVIKQGTEAGSAPSPDPGDDEPRGLDGIISDPTIERCLILGGPGSGKSTFALAEAAVLAQLALAGQSPTVPLLVELASFAHRLLADPGFSILEYVEESARRAGISNLGEAIRRLSRRGHLILLCDGADEVPDETVPLVIESIHGTAPIGSGNRVVVTSRPTSLSAFVGYARADIGLISVEDQLRLIVSICGETTAEELLAAIDRYPELGEAGRSPMMTVILALVARDAADRAELDVLRQGPNLYRVATKLLLEGKYRRRRGVLDSFRAEGILSVASIVLHELASSAYGSEIFSDVEVERAIGLAEPDDVAVWTSPRAFLDDIARVSGILYPANELKSRYQYAHRTFREYFSARYLSMLSSERREEVLASVLGDQAWSQVVVFLSGLVPDTDRMLRYLVLHSPELALMAMANSAVLDPEMALDLLRVESATVHVRRRAFSLLAHSAPSLDRLVDLLIRYLDEAGSSLPRCDLVFIEDILRRTPYAPAEIESSVYAHMPPVPESLLDGPPDLAGSYWCNVPAGRCIIGARPDDPEKLDWVPEEFEVDVPAFDIGRVVVTNDTYEHFDPAHIAFRHYEGHPSDAVLDHHPVVQISWYEAEAFCRWASQRFSGVRLPMEVEWEKAASWNGTEKLKYPWGNLWDGRRLNTWRTGARGTAPVGVNKRGVSPSGAYDMLGNVWEWCADWFTEDLRGFLASGLLRSPESGERRVDRGGAWARDIGPVSMPATFMRAADDPADRFPHCGFRLARTR